MNRIAFLIITFVALICVSCGGDQSHKTLLEAERYVTDNTDSCAILLKKVDLDNLNEEDKALYGLISSWLLYRQYVKEIPEEPLRTAFEYFHDGNNPLRRAQVYFLRGVIHADQLRGKESEWMEDLYSASLAIEQTDDYLLASQIYQNYSTKFTHVQRYEEARVWVDKFVEAARMSGRQGEYVQALIYKSENCLKAEEKRVEKEYNTTDGNLIAKHGDFNEAFSTIYKALGIAQQNNFRVALGRIYTQLTLCHSTCQNLDSLLYYAELSVRTNEQLHEEGVRKEATNYVLLCDAHRKLGHADSAIFYAMKTMDTDGTPLRNKRAAAHLLYNIYADLKGDYKTSMEWMKVFNQLTDSINQSNITANINAVQTAAISEQEKSSLKKENKHTLDWLIWSVVIGATVIIAISVILIINRRRYHRELQKKEEELNRMICDMHHKTGQTKEQPSVISETDDGKDNSPSDIITLTGNTKEKVTVNASSILFITSDSNYIRIFHLDAEGKVQSKMIRQTMTSIESQLKNYPHIVRCHRAFIVNLQHAKNAKSTSAGLLLALDATTERVPVSKTYISFIKSRMQ